MFLLELGRIEGRAPETCQTETILKCKKNTCDMFALRLLTILNLNSTDFV